MLVGSGLVVPVILWGKTPPSHTVTAIALSLDQKLLFTGSVEGQLCLWDVNLNSQMCPKMIYYGHAGSITSIAAAGPDRFASADDKGGLCLWNTLENQCLESKRSSQIHISMQAHKFDEKHFHALLCNGHYPEINIMNAENLEIIYSLVARVHPDWVNAFCLLKPLRQQDDIILGVTNSGTIKMWTINMQTVNSMHVYEDESKQIRCVDAKMIRCCPYNQRTLLIVCAKYWQIYDAGEFSLLCSEIPNQTTQWIGGHFIGVDSVIVWNCNGQAYIYKLPSNSNPEHKDYHHFVGTKALQYASPTLCYVIETELMKILPSPRVFLCEQLPDSMSYVLVRVDADSSIHHWLVNKDGPITNKCVSADRAIHSRSLAQVWKECKPPGLLDHVRNSLAGELDTSTTSVSCSLYIANTGRLLSGLNNGDIVIVPVLHTVKRVLLSASSDDKGNTMMFRVLKGHKSRVNCLLYPHSIASRYSPNHLLSGSSDFSVCLWDLALGHLIHRFAVHAGEVTQFYIPPPSCNSRILSCICSVANDHSVALLSLKDKRPLVFASRHMFPVLDIKWRPVEDFMVISCSDSTAYVWQMETGLLDRVVHGVTAVEILKACDETRQKVTLDGDSGSPQISLGQAIRRRNFATFRNFAQQALNDIENLVDGDDEDDSALYDQNSPTASLSKHALTVQSLSSNDQHTDAHIILFDTEALILQLLCDEFGIPASHQYSKSPGGRTQQEHNAPVRENMEGAGETYSSNSAAKARSANQSQSSNKVNRDATVYDKPESFLMEEAQIILSLIHAWTLDKDLDVLCMKKLGLLRFNRSVLFGLLSGNGHAAFMLPQCDVRSRSDERKDGCAESSRYWEVCGPLTTQHLLSVISLTNTLMSMASATFIKPNVSDVKHALVSGDSQPKRANVDQVTDQVSKQSQAKQGWSLLAALHCILLPDLVDGQQYKGPTLHLLASRWQDRCIEIREASQALLLAEMRRIGSAGRKRLISQWAPFMPNLVDDNHGTVSLAASEIDLLVGSDADEPHLRRVKSERRRQEATAIVIFGVIGAEFGSDIELTDVTQAWHTSKALSYLLLNQLENKLSSNVPIRRAAIDLLGRGFSVWQPYIDVSAILLGLLEICVDAERIIPSDAPTGLPLSASADACRTARHSLSLIATAQPATFLTCMAKEVTRYNAAAQSTQSSAQPHSSVIVRAKSEILRVIENLIDKLPNSVADLLLETMDVAVHCLDANIIKSHGLQVAFPALCKFPMVSYCTNSRRICVGSKNGSLAFYEIKQSKAQTIPFQASPTAAMIFYLKPSSKEMIPAHQGAVAAVCFSEDGKYLASYSPTDSRVNFWQTSASSLFSSQHTKCIKSYSVPWKNPAMDKVNAATRAGRISWSDHRTASLVLPDGTESRYKI